MGGWVGGGRVICALAGALAKAARRRRDRYLAHGVRHGGGRAGEGSRHAESVWTRPSLPPQPASSTTMRAAARMLVAALLAAAAVAQVSTPIFSDADADAHAARSPLAWRAAVEDKGAMPVTGRW